MGIAWLRSKIIIDVLLIILIKRSVSLKLLFIHVIIKEQ